MAGFAAILKEVCSEPHRQGCAASKGTFPSVEVQPSMFEEAASALQRMCSEHYRGGYAVGMGVVPGIEEAPSLVHMFMVVLFSFLVYSGWIPDTRQRCLQRVAHTRWASGGRGGPPDLAVLCLTQIADSLAE